MLYWYSGTGNSRHIAHRISSLIGDADCRFIPSELGVESKADRNISATEDCCRDMVGFCFPVYSWGVPPVVLKLIENIGTKIFEGKYVYAVLTCGDEAGLAATMFRKALERRGIQLNAAFTVIMPNDYVMLPGFDIDSKDLQREKLTAAEKRVIEIAGRLKERAKVEDVFKGPMPWIKTCIVYPLFRRWGVQPVRWEADAAKCIGCGKCVNVCPAGNIRLSENKRPLWGKRCYSCTACFHICPVRAIDYGCFSKGKKQYFCPEN